MKKSKFKRVLSLLILLTTLGVTMISCGIGKDSKSNDDKVIKIAVADIKVYEEAIKATAKQLEKDGYTLDYTLMADNTQMNQALENGEVFANHHQHTAYLKEFNEANGTDISVAFEAFVDRAGLFSKKYKSINDLPDGANISIPSDYGNNFRTFIMLEDAGLIKLKDGVEPEKITKADIVENPHHFTFTEVEYPMLARALEDADAGFLYATVAADNGFIFDKDVLIEEKKELQSTDIIAVRSEDIDSEKALALKKAYQSDAVKEALKDAYNGEEILVPAW